MESSPYDEFVGHVFADRYHIDAVLGAGAMGGVFRATDLRQNRAVAVKMLDPVLLNEASIRDELIKRFQREIQTTQTLNHPNVVALLDSGRHDVDKLFLVLELLDGVDLDHYVGTPMAPERVSWIAQQIAAALGEAHRHGIVHRDLKPGNVLLVKAGDMADVVKVVDFGIARMLETHHEVTAVTRAGTTVGTPQYMAPEQAMAQPVSPATDLYALGAMIYELLTGRPMFTADNDMMVALAHVNEPPPPLVVPGLSPEQTAAWQAVLASLLAKEPARRPQSADAVVAQLRALAPDTPDPVALLKRSQRTTSAKGPPAGILWVIAILTGLALAALGAAIW